MNRKILITNDDGIDTSGIERLARAAAKFGEVWVVAPESQRSAASHSITLRNPIDVFPHDFPVPGVHAYAVFGTPADCARVGILGVMKEKPDVFLSGINFGYNAGTDVQYSGTCGAAMEAVFQGIPAVAFSEGLDFGTEAAGAYLDEILSKVIDREYAFGEIVNVNFPNCKAADIKGIKWDRTTSHFGYFVDSYVGMEIPGGMQYAVHGTNVLEGEEGTDLEALFNNYVSVGVLKNIG